MLRFDVAIIGGGILGLATALQLQRKNPALSIAIIEKEHAVAKHQTGHNSGVIHSGIYYKPGSLKAQNCIEGVKQLLQFCDEHSIPYERCGKVIVATNTNELPRLEELAKRGFANGVPGLQVIGPDQLKEIEPAVKGLKAIYSPNTAIIDFTKVAQEYAKVFISKGGNLFLGECLTGIKQLGNESRLMTTNKEISAKFVINCTGTHADNVALLAKAPLSAGRILPFRGEYYNISAQKQHLVKGLIYPVPDPKFPFLGVHLSKTIHGYVEAGPNAILALSREGYKPSDINWQDVRSFLSYKGFWRMSARYWKIGLYEIYRSLSKQAFLKSLQRLVPELQESDLVPGGSGVRSQVVRPDGTMADDFVIVNSSGMIHILNAPSPAATASLSIGNYVANLAFKHLSE